MGFGIVDVLCPILVPFPPANIITFMGIPLFFENF